MLASHVYTLHRLRHSRLLPRPLPLLGHLGVLKAQTKRHDDILLGLRAMAREAKDGAYSILLGTRGVTIVTQPQMVRAVLTSKDLMHRPTREKWAISSAVSRPLPGKEQRRGEGWRQRERRRDSVRAE